MTPEVINMIAQFMQRVQLNAQEIDAFQTCMQCLQAEMMRLREVEDGPVESSTDD